MKCRQNKSGKLKEKKTVRNRLIKENKSKEGKKKKKK